MTPPTPAEGDTDGGTRIYRIFARVIQTEPGDGDDREYVVLRQVGRQKAANHDSALRAWGNSNLAQAKSYRSGFVIATDSAVKEIDGAPEERFVTRELVTAESPL